MSTRHEGTKRGRGETVTGRKSMRSEIKGQKSEVASQDTDDSLRLLRFLRFLRDCGVSDGRL
jgi:hypothetical protein